MAVEQGKIQTSVWKDVDRVGFIRQLWQARKWHGADWWLAFLSAIGLVFFVLLAAFPGFFARYDYNEVAGPTLLGPGEVPKNYILIAPRGAGYESIDAIDDGIEKRSDSKQIGTLDPNASTAVSTLQDEGMYVRSARLQNDVESPYELLQALENGQVDAVVGDQDTLRPLMSEFPTLIEVDYVGKHYDQGFVLGTNHLGYDILSRLIYGTATTLKIGLIAALASFILGVPLGLVSGYISGPLDRVLTLVMDSLYSFPGLILAIAITAVLDPAKFNNFMQDIMDWDKTGILDFLLGKLLMPLVDPNLYPIIIAIAVLYIPTYFRIVRGQTLAIKEALYVEAAKSLGASRRVTLYRYVFPNVLASIGVIFSVNVADAILTGAGLSFLGLGLPVNIPDWGVDLATGQDYMRSSWWMVVFPGLAITLVTLCFSLLGESLSEIFNPRLNRQ